MLYCCPKCNYTPHPQTPSIFDKLRVVNIKQEELKTIRTRHRNNSMPQTGLSLVEYYQKISKVK